MGVLRDDGWDHAPVTVERGLLRALLDVASSSMDFGSGFLVDEEVNAMRTSAELLGIDPMLVTPPNFKCQYIGHSFSKVVAGMYGGEYGDWWCVNCHTTVKEAPPEEQQRTFQRIDLEFK